MDSLKWLAEHSIPVVFTLLGALFCLLVWALINGIRQPRVAKDRGMEELVKLLFQLPLKGDWWRAAGVRCQLHELPQGACFQQLMADGTHSSPRQVVSHDDMAKVVWVRDAEGKVGMLATDTPVRTCRPDLGILN